MVVRTFKCKTVNATVAICDDDVDPNAKIDCDRILKIAMSDPGGRAYLMELARKEKEAEMLVDSGQ